MNTTRRLKQGAEKGLQRVFLTLLIGLLAIAGTATLVWAAETSDADYYGVITVSNNGTVATDVSVNCSLNTPAMVNSGYLNSSANNCAVVNTGGAVDVPFMPGVNATSPWCFFTPYIGANSYKSLILYTGNVTGGHIAYFPGDEGMTADNFSIGSNFEIEQAGWVDTTAVGANLISKLDAFRTYISGSENITAGILPDYPSTITQEVQDGDIAIRTGLDTRAGQRIDDFLAGEITKVEFYLKKLGGPTGTASIRVRAVSDDSILGTIGTINVATLSTDYAWKSFSTTPVTVPSGQDIRILVEYSGGSAGNNVYLGRTDANETAYGQRTSYDGGYTDTGTQDATFRLYFTPNFVASVTASSVSSGNHTVKVTANGTDFKIYIDSTENASTSQISWGVPTTASDNGGAKPWSDIVKSYDNNLTTFAYTADVGSGGGTNNLDFTTTSLPCSKIRFYADVTSATSWRADPYVYYDGGWHSLGFLTDFTKLAWVEVDTGTSSNISQGRIKLWNLSAPSSTPKVYEFQFLKTMSVPDNDNDWSYVTNGAMSYMDYTAISVNGTPQQYITWQYDDTVFTDPYGHNATPTFRTASSSENVSAKLTMFLPMAEAKAPAWALDTTPGELMGSTTTTTGNFTTTPSPTSAPFIAVIEAVSTATATPSQLPFTIIAGFVIVACSLGVSHLMKTNNTNSLFIKLTVIILLFGIFIAVKVFDFWMLVFFLIPGIAIILLKSQGQEV